MISFFKKGAPPQQQPQQVAAGTAPVELKTVAEPTPSHSTEAAPMPKSPDQGRSSSHIRRHDDLIRKLVIDHREMLGLYGAVSREVEQENWQQIETMLGTFKSKLQDHLLDEAIRLYAYMNKNFDDDPTTLAILRSYRSEMDGIGKAVLETIGRYRDIQNRLDLQQTFGKEWQEIGVTLGDRIKREETVLYPLY